MTQKQESSFLKKRTKKLLFIWRTRLERPLQKSKVFCFFSSEKKAFLPAAFGLFTPAGPIAAEDRHMFVVIMLIMAIVVVPVFVLTPWFAWRYRLGNRASAYRPKWSFSWTLEAFIWGIPAAIVITLGVNLWRETHRLDPYRPISSALPALQVQAVGLNWKWLFVYPEQNIATLNELAFPADRPVHLSITSDTVMQSLFIPQIAGQIYAMAGMTTQLNFKAYAPGTFMGENTQFSGTLFQDQKFVARALVPAEFNAWVAHAKQVGTPLNKAVYTKVAEKSSLPNPVYFAPVEAGLFASIIDHYRTGKPGTTAQALEASP
jgi:cytochrome o ubiquinol oxidase subunit 2